MGSQSIIHRLVSPLANILLRSKLTLARRSEQRVSIGSGDFIRIQGHEVSIARVDLVFAHELSAGEKRLFFLVTDVVRPSPAVDEALEVPRLQLTENWRVVGLPAVSSSKVWAVPISKRSQRFEPKDATYCVDGRSGQGGHKDLLLCPWEINFM